MKNFKTFTSEGVNDPAIFKAIFTAGGPGSGKSFVAGKTTAGFGMKVLNSDDILEFLIKKTGQSLNTLKMTPKEFEKFLETRQKAKKLSAAKQKILVDGKLGMVIDGTGRRIKKISDHRQHLVDMGYDTFMIFVNTSLEVAHERNRNRPRKLPLDVVEKYWRDVQNNLGSFQSLFGRKNFRIVDNNDAEEDVFLKVNKQVRAFVKEPIKSKIALEWIKDQKEKK